MQFAFLQNYILIHLIINIGGQVTDIESQNTQIVTQLLFDMSNNNVM